MKKIKILFIFLALFFISFFIGYFIHQEQTKKEQEAIFYQNKMEKELVIDSLKKNYQIVGLEGNIQKEYGYQNQLFDAKWEWVQKLGEREYKTVISGIFKMGFNTEDIQSDHIFMEKDTIKIITPDVTLISLELPYDKMQIKEEVGILRHEFSEEEKQYIYKQASEKIKQELLYDEETIKKASDETKEHMRILLKEISGKRKIEFIDR